MTQATGKWGYICWVNLLDLQCSLTNDRIRSVFHPLGYSPMWKGHFLSFGCRGLAIPMLFSRQIHPHYGLRTKNNILKLNL